MEKAYLVILDKVYYFEQTLDIKVFKSYEKAKESMEKIIKDLKDNGEFENWDFKGKAKDYLEFYNDGNYLENHIVIGIEEREVE